jgi:general secretion pathway protein G
MIVQKTQRRQKREAFTLMELMIVVALLVVLAGTGGFYYMRTLESGKKKAAQTQVNTIADQVQMYYLDHNSTFPPSLQALSQADQTGTPQMAAKDLMDPWQKPYQYDPNGSHNGGSKPDVWTTAPDGTVIGNWQ